MILAPTALSSPETDARGTVSPRAAASAIQPYVRLEHVVKRYAPGGPAAVDDVSLDIARGEFFALLGRPAAARRRCCAWSRASSGPTRAASCSTVPTWRVCRLTPGP